MATWVTVPRLTRNALDRITSVKVYLMQGDKRTVFEKDYPDAQDIELAWRVSYALNQIASMSWADIEHEQAQDF